jgi:hypothetical protein
VCWSRTSASESTAPLTVVPMLRETMAGLSLFACLVASWDVGRELGHALRRQDWLTNIYTTTGTNTTTKYRTKMRNTHRGEGAE